MFVWLHGHEALKRKAWMGRKGQWCAHTEVLMWGLSGICSEFIRRKKPSFSVLHNTRISHLLVVNWFARGENHFQILFHVLFMNSLWPCWHWPNWSQTCTRNEKSNLKIWCPPSTGQQSKCAAKLAWAWPNDLNSRTLPLYHWTNIKILFSQLLNWQLQSPQRTIIWDIAIGWNATKVPYYQDYDKAWW